MSALRDKIADAMLDKGPIPFGLADDVTRAVQAHIAEVLAGEARVDPQPIAGEWYRDAKGVIARRIGDDRTYDKWEHYEADGGYPDDHMARPLIHVKIVEVTP